MNFQNEFTRTDYIDFIEKLVKEEKSKNIFFGIKQTTILGAILFCVRELYVFLNTKVIETTNIYFFLTIVIFYNITSLIWQIYNLSFRHDMCIQIEEKKLSNLDKQHIKYSYYYDFGVLFLNLGILLYLFINHKLWNKINIIPFIIFFIYYFSKIVTMYRFIIFKIIGDFEKIPVIIDNRIVKIVKSVFVIVYIYYTFNVFNIFNHTDLFPFNLLLLVSIIIAIQYLLNFYILIKSRNVIVTYLEILRNEIYIKNLCRNEIQKKLEDYLDRVESDMIFYNRLDNSSEIVTNLHRMYDTDNLAE